MPNTKYKLQFLTFIINVPKFNVYKNITKNIKTLSKNLQGAFQWASRPPTGDQPVTRSQWNASDLPCDLPCAASLAGIQPVRPRAQRTSP